MKHFFPPIDRNYRYLQTNRSDTLGSLWSTFNIDFQSNLGKMRLAQKLVTNTTSSDDADLGLPTAFEYFDDRWFAICGTRVFKNTSEELISGFSEDASTGAQTDFSARESDLKVFGDGIDVLFATTTDALYSKAQGTGAGDWTSRDTLGSGGCHQLSYFRKFNRMYYADDRDTISSIDGAFAVKNAGSDYAVELPLNNGQDITCQVATSDSIFIGVRSKSNSATGIGSVGSIFQWDGISSQVTREYKIETAGVMAMCVIDDIPYAIDTEGRVLQFTGYSFKEIARLPVSRILLSGSTSTGDDVVFIHFNGMVGTKNNTILFLIDNNNSDSGETINENLPSGIWELDLATNNLTHRYSATLKARSSSTVTDFGQNRILSAGAIKMNIFQSDSTSGRPTLICGMGYYTDATTTKYGIFIDSPVGASTDNEGQKRGYFVTTWFEAGEILEKFNKISEVHRMFLDSADKIIFKYRLTEETPVYATITWVDTTHFTTTTDVSAYGPTQTPFDGTTGGEVEVIQGSGGGNCAHITSVVNNAGTYTVTIDKAATGVTTGTAKARFQKWRKIIPEITGQVDDYSQRDIGKTGTRMQIKGVLEFTGNNEFHKFILSSENHIKLEG